MKKLIVASLFVGLLGLGLGCTPAPTTKKPPTTAAGTGAGSEKAPDTGKAPETKEEKKDDKKDKP